MNDEQVMTPALNGSSHDGWVGDLIADGKRDQTAAPYYYAPGDELFVFWKRDVPYAERVDDALTVFRSVRSHELVGFVAKDVRERLRRKNPTVLTAMKDSEYAILVILQVLRKSVDDHEQGERSTESRDATYQRVKDQVEGLSLPPDLIAAVAS